MGGGPWKDCIVYTHAFAHAFCGTFWGAQLLGIRLIPFVFIRVVWEFCCFSGLFAVFIALFVREVAY